MRARRKFTRSQASKSSAITGRTRAATLRDTRSWRQRVRPRAVQRAVAAARSLSWSPNLLELLIEELYIDDSIEELLGVPLRHLPRRRYAEAVGTALIIRHSWQAADLSCVLTRLGLKRLPSASRKRSASGPPKARCLPAALSAQSGSYPARHEGDVP
jgi:hypothetical protein